MYLFLQTDLCALLLVSLPLFHSTHLSSVCELHLLLSPPSQHNQSSTHYLLYAFEVL